MRKRSSLSGYLGPFAIKTRSSSVIPVITGGVKTSDANYYYHTFSTVNQTFSFSSNLFNSVPGVPFDYLVVAGGGGGGSMWGPVRKYYPNGSIEANYSSYNAGGGGGAGGLLQGSYSISANQTFYVRSGSGGIGGVYVASNSSAATSGNNSYISTDPNGSSPIALSYGGGFGGGQSTWGIGSSGGSGGGGESIVEAASGVAGQGNNSGTGLSYASRSIPPTIGIIRCGGGGGSSSVGESHSYASLEGYLLGGSGTSSSISGSSVLYSRGGDGGTTTLGYFPINTTIGIGFGGYGGGREEGYRNGQNGGNGIVIIRYLRSIVGG